MDKTFKIILDQYLMNHLAYLILMLFLSFSDNLLYDIHIIFKKVIVNFEIEHKTCLYLG